MCDLGVPLPALCRQAWVQLVVTPLPSFDPNKPLEEESWPGAPVALGGWGEERSAPPTPSDPREFGVSHLEQNSAQVLLVYTQEGAKSPSATRFEN